MTNPQLEQRLQECTVKITATTNTSNSHGTGFFVAPGWILTCAHVVVETKIKSESIRVWIQDKGFIPKILKCLDGDYLDLALLEIEYREHPCVRLVPENIITQIYTFGYQRFDDGNKGGFSQRLDYQGLQYRDSDQKQPLLGFAQGYMHPGLSGAAILNVVTGTVVGIAQITNDNRYPFGGAALPTEQIFEYLPEVAQANLTFHATHPHVWREIEPVNHNSVVKALDRRALIIGSGWSPYLPLCRPEHILAAQKVYSILYNYFPKPKLLINHDATCTQITSELHNLCQIPVRSSNFVYWSGAGRRGDPHRLWCYDGCDPNGDPSIYLNDLAQWLAKLAAYDQSVFLYLHVPDLPIDQLRQQLKQASQSYPRCAIVIEKQTNQLDELDKLQEHITNWKSHEMFSKQLCEILQTVMPSGTLEIISPNVDFQVW